MTLAIFNGSPRRHKSNTTLLIDHFLAGYRTRKADGNVTVAFVSGKENLAANLEIFSRSPQVIICFPLYTDCMPGVVKEFFESILAHDGQRPRDLGFVVQSGFPEAIHSVYVERYLRKFTQRLGCNYLGTVIKGGVEGIQVMPQYMTKKLFTNFRSLGESFGEKGAFSPKIMKKLKGPLRMSKIKYFGFSLLSKTSLLNFYWDDQLKKNGAYNRRFDRPLDLVEASK
jgi:hypothetical protein